MKHFLIVLGCILCSVFSVKAQPGNTTCKVAGLSNVSVTVSPPTAKAVTYVNQYGVESVCIECSLTLSKKASSDVMITVNVYDGSILVANEVIYIPRNQYSALRLIESSDFIDGKRYSLRIAEAECE